MIEQLLCVVISLEMASLMEKKMANDLNCILHLSLVVMESLYDRKIIVMAKGIAVKMVTKFAMVTALMVYPTMETGIILGCMER